MPHPSFFFSQVSEVLKLLGSKWEEVLIDNQHIDILKRLGVNIPVSKVTQITEADKVKEQPAKPKVPHEASCHVPGSQVLEDRLTKALDVQRVENVDAVQKESLNEQIGKPKAQFTCTHCRRAFPRKGNLANHINWKHMKRTNNNRFHCNTCGGSFNSKLKLKRHQCKSRLLGISKEVDEKRPTCNLCNKSFSTKGNLNLHTKKKHTLFSCRKCPFQTEILKELKEHKSNKLKRFPCIGYQSNLESNMNLGAKLFEHMKAKHQEFSTTIEFDDSGDEDSAETVVNGPRLPSTEDLNTFGTLPAIEFDDSDSE